MHFLPKVRIQRRQVSSDLVVKESADEDQTNMMVLQFGMIGSRSFVGDIVVELINYGKVHLMQNDGDDKEKMWKEGRQETSKESVLSFA